MGERREWEREEAHPLPNNCRQNIFLEKNSKQKKKNPKNFRADFFFFSSQKSGKMKNNFAAHHLLFSLLKHFGLVEDMKVLSGKKTERLLVQVYEGHPKK